jgi:hypothetical protein
LKRSQGRSERKRRDREEICHASCVCVWAEREREREKGDAVKKKKNTPRATPLRDISKQSTIEPEEENSHDLL